MATRNPIKTHQLSFSSLSPLFIRKGFLHTYIQTVLFFFLPGGSELGGGFNFFLFSPLLGEILKFDSYFSDGFKPPTSEPSTDMIFGSGLTHPFPLIAIPHPFGFLRTLRVLWVEEENPELRVSESRVSKMRIGLTEQHRILWIGCWGNQFLRYFSKEPFCSCLVPKQAPKECVVRLRACYIKRLFSS